ncbi:MAG: rhamnulokinase [Lentisphaeria bacterium]|nr:rhamnulokinase [Lentisphaeria bacterium]
MASEKYVAADMGASSGRVIVGILENGKLVIEEMHRFDNGPVERAGSLYWDMDMIFREIRTGVKKAFAKYPDILSFAVDTWGVDYVLVKEDGSFARAPYNYRDARTDNVPEEVFRTIPEPELYARTGIQKMQLNTLYQLYAHKKAHPEDFEGTTLLMIPDAITFLFSGDRTCEYTEASTSNLLDASSRSWDWKTIDALGFDRKLFPAITSSPAGTGRVNEKIAKELGIPQIPVCKVGSHDTASAVAAVPAEKGSDFVYVSFGTWALFGAELAEPVLTEAARKAGFTNEGGLNGKIRFLTNIIGMWLAQELRADWSKRDGEKIPWSRIDAMAKDAEGLKYLIDPNAREFLSPGDMYGKICRFCERTGQGTPDDAAAIRCVYDSLSMCFRAKLETLEALSGKKFAALNIVGGGSNASVIMQIASDICGRKIIAGPVEATASGNILAQAMANGSVKDLDHAREIVRASFRPGVYTPADTDRKKFDAAYAKFLSIVGK